MPSALLVMNNPRDWPLKMRGVEIVPARAYLAESRFSELRGVRVFNLCRSYRYQSIGYYVSLLAAARGHRPLPSITTLQDMKSLSIVRLISEDLEELIQRSLHPVQSKEFTLSIYFGRNMARRHDRLARHLFTLFQAPLLRAHFVFDRAWVIESIGPMAASEIPEDHRPYVVEFAQEFFAGRMPSVARRRELTHELAILWNPEDGDCPSDQRAINRFIRIAAQMDIEAEVIGRSDYGRVAEFDALFIRDNTELNSYTYRFARRAAAEGVVVIDDPESIFRCNNKVYLAELLSRHGLRTPKTLIVHRDNDHLIRTEIGFPCILKQPDSTFSAGVSKVENEVELEEALERLLARSELIIAQEFMPTEFDWRIGVLDRHPLFAAKYHMAHRHWQIIKHGPQGAMRWGEVEAVPLETVPPHVLHTATRAANLIGDGLYGVDLKESGRRCYVIEVNDCPNIDAGCEDRILGDELYRRILAVFLRRIERRRGAH
ncbi:MAG: RimK family protein [Candidatus Sumerlaeia bacterium]|nr:RimK family protein [Candidatus Sumerlaeia bacterium]